MKAILMDPPFLLRIQDIVAVVKVMPKGSRTQRNEGKTMDIPSSTENGRHHGGDTTRTSATKEKEKHRKNWLVVATTMLLNSALAEANQMNEHLLQEL